MSKELENLLNLLSKTTVEDKIFVFFNPEDGSINKIGNLLDNETHHSYVQVTHTEVESIMKGQRSMNEYEVRYDIAYKEHRLFERNLTTVNDYVYNTVHELPIKIKKKETYKKSPIDADVVIYQDNNEKKWKIALSKKLRDTLLGQTLSLKHSVFFSVTAKHDANILYRSINCTISDLLYNETGILEFPFENEFEFDKEQVSVYTSRYFENYLHEIVG